MFWRVGNLGTSKVRYTWRQRHVLMTNRIKWTIVGSSTGVVIMLLLGAASGRATSPDDVYGHLRVYTEVLQRIKLEYAEEPDMKSITLGAINGLLESVDPFASYLNADQYKQYVKNRDSAKAGVGMILAKKYGYVTVVDTLPNSPNRQGEPCSRATWWRASTVSPRATCRWRLPSSCWVATRALRWK